jgi:hypothetical protein
MSPYLPMVAEQIGHNLDYYGHRVDIPPGLLSWFFWSIGKEYYLYWRDTEQPVRIENKTMRLQLAPRLGEEGLTFDIMLGADGKPPFSILGREVFFYGRLPLWVCWNRGLLSGADGAFLGRDPGDGAKPALYPHGRRLGVPGPGVVQPAGVRPARP